MCNQHTHTVTLANVQESCAIFTHDNIECENENDIQIQYM